MGQTVHELNFLPLMVRRFGAKQTLALLGFLAVWGFAGCPEFSGLGDRGVMGIARSTVYKYVHLLKLWRQELERDGWRWATDEEFARVVQERARVA
jgi:hypothetical protein